MKIKYQNRALVSFKGKCPMNCKHCYTFDLDDQEEISDVSEVVNANIPVDCDIIYVSQRYENFYDEEIGYDLCSSLYEKYHKDIFIITRSVLSDAMMQKLSDLNKQMAMKGHTLYLSVSICADASYAVTEDVKNCPTPSQRISNLQRAHMHGIRTVLMLRPIFPDKIIPISECLSFISQYAYCIDAVVTSGLIVTQNILKRLNLEQNELAYNSTGDSSYLADLQGKDIYYVDVEDELRQIESQCAMNHVPCFRHSMPALNFIANH